MAKNSSTQSAPTAPTRPLTQRQQEIFDFLKSSIAKRGFCPSIREIGSKFGILSPNGVMCHLKALERKKLISREPNLSRAVKVLV